MPEPIELTVAPGGVLRRFAPDEARALAQQWVDTFSGTGAPATKRYLWHVFSGEACPSVSLKDAEAEYARHEAPSYIVLSNRRDAALETDVRPLVCDTSDWLVFPPNMAWTMAFTHEDGWLGPYFAKHDDYATLHPANLDRIRKLQEIASARARGWR